MGLSRIVSEINGDFCLKSFIFHVRVFNAPAEGVPLEFCNGGSTQKTRAVPLPQGAEFDNKCIRVDTIPAGDRQTERRTDLP